MASIIADSSCIESNVSSHHRWGRPAPARLRSQPGWRSSGPQRWPSDALSDRKHTHTTIKHTHTTEAPEVSDRPFLLPWRASWSRAEWGRGARPPAKDRLGGHTAEPGERSWQLLHRPQSGTVLTCCRYTPSPSAAFELLPEKSRTDFFPRVNFKIASLFGKDRQISQRSILQFLVWYPALFGKQQT